MFDLYTLFITSTVAFNCGQIFLQIFGFNLDGLLAGRFSANTLFETVLFVNIALAVIHLGAILKLKGLTKIAEPGHALKAPPELFHVGFVLVVISILPTLIVLNGLIDVVRSSGYFGLYEREDLIGFDNVYTLISQFFVPGILMMIAGAKDKIQYRMFSEIGLIVYAIIFMILGRRGDGGQILISYCMVRHTCIKPIPKKIVLPIAILIFGVVFPILAVVRNFNLDSRTDISVMLSALDSIENPFATALGEMGGSMQSISYTMDLVPKSRAYDYGASYFYSIFSLVPNLFWSLHPSIARGSPSIWLVKEVDPIIASMGGGIGFSYIAEAYLNFGWWGGPFLLFLIGYLVSALVRWSQFYGDPVRIAIAASFFGSILTFARADSQSVIRPLVWYSLLPYLAVILLQKMNQNKKKSNLLSTDSKHYRD